MFGSKLLMTGGEEPYFPPNSTILNSFGCPEDGVVALAGWNGNMYSIIRDGTFNAEIELWQHVGITSSASRVINLGQTSRNGATIIDGNLITLNGNNRIDIHVGLTTSLSGSLTGYSSLGSLTTDGTNLIWATTGGTVTLCDGIGYSQLDQITLSAPGAMRGVGWDQGNLVGVFENTDEIVIYDGFSTTELTSFAAPAGQPRGGAIINGSLMTCDFSTDLIYQHGRDS